MPPSDPPTNPSSPAAVRRARSPLRPVSLALLLSAPVLRAATLTGNVSNGATGDLLEGARVEVPVLGLTVFTDNTGRYVLPSLPAGPHELVVTYTGLDPCAPPSPSPPIRPPSAISISRRASTNLMPSKSPASARAPPRSPPRATPRTSRTSSPPIPSAISPT
ncbi:MAG: hypothetical protein EXS40_04865 [Opitutaceae bacterium]|nr:hypothetical protein [Opitutaceae bacterium]